MGMVMGVTAVVLGLAAALVGLMVWTTLLFPRPTARARRALEHRPGRSFTVGVVLAIVVGVPSIALTQAVHGGARLMGWALLFPLLALGLTAMAQLLGERLRQMSPALTPLGAFVGGAVTLELAAAVPFFGWFLFAPLVGVTLLGAGALGMLHRSPGAADPSTEEPHPQREAESPLVSVPADAWRPAPGVAPESALR